MNTHNTLPADTREIVEWLQTRQYLKPHDTIERVLMDMKINANAVTSRLPVGLDGRTLIGRLSRTQIAALASNTVPCLQ